MRRALWLALAALALAACRDAGSPLSPVLSSAPGGPRSSIADGANGGNPHFYFLPPMVAKPQTGGVASLGLRPSVEVCSLATDPCTRVATFLTGSGSPSIRVEDQHYQVDWDTRSSGVRPGDVVRITVYPRARRAGEATPPPALGHVDAKIVDGKKDVQPVPGGLIAVVYGRTLPISFRIEQGAISAAQAMAAGKEPQACNDCVEEVVTGGKAAKVIAPSRYAGAFLPGDALPAGTEIIFTINRINPHGPAGPCFPTSAIPGEDPLAVPPQAEGCYEYSTEPVLESGFEIPVQVAMCLDPAKSLDAFDLFKSSPRRQDAFSRVPFSRHPSPSYLGCTGFAASAVPVARGSGAARLLRMASAGWHSVAAPLGRLLGPGLLAASDRAISGDVRLLSSSRLGWGEVLSAGIVIGDRQTAPVGTTLSQSPTVQVLSGRPGHDHVLKAAPGLPVRFDFYGAVDSLDNFIISVDSLENLIAVDSLDNFLAAVDSLDPFPLQGISSRMTTAGTDGKTSVDWTLPSAPGTYLMRVTVPGGARRWFSAKATALPDLVVFSIGNSPDPDPTMRRITAVVRNQGVGKAGASTLELVVRDAQGVAVASEELQVAQLAPEGSQTLVLRFSPVPGATYTVHGRADLKGVVVESNENNNTQKHTFTAATS